MTSSEGFCIKSRKLECGKKNALAPRVVKNSAAINVIKVSNASNNTSQPLQTGSRGAAGGATGGRYAVSEVVIEAGIGGFAPISGRGSICGFSNKDDIQLSGNRLARNRLRKIRCQGLPGV